LSCNKSRVLNHAHIENFMATGFWDEEHHPSDTDAVRSGRILEERTVSTLKENHF
jgi:hypothetical protein